MADTMPPPDLDLMRVFDRRIVRLHRQRAAARLADHDFLLREVAGRLADRLDDVRRDFATVLDLGSHDGVMARVLAARPGVETVVSSDLSPAMVRQAPGLRVAADEELLPFAPGSFDLVTSCLSLHWVNDLPGALAQIRMALKPDGLFLAAMFGGGTLAELRQALLEGEAEAEGGASPRVSPFADARDAAGLLQRAELTLPVVDVDTVTVTYPHPIALMRDLRGMGEANAVRDRRSGFTPRSTLLGAAARYQDRFPTKDGRVTATFQVLYLTAWAPHRSQPKPLRPGSARARLADALGSREISTGVKPGPDDR